MYVVKYDTKRGYKLKYLLVQVSGTKELKRGKWTQFKDKEYCGAHFINNTELTQNLGLIITQILL